MGAAAPITTAPFGLRSAGKANLTAKTTAPGGLLGSA